MEHTELARMGGRAVLAKHGKEHFKAMRAKSAGNHKKPDSKVSKHALYMRQYRANKRASTISPDSTVGLSCDNI